MKSYEALIKENQDLRMENASLRAKLDIANEQIESLTGDLATMCACDDDCDCSCECSHNEAELNFDAELFKAELADKVDAVVSTAKTVGTKVVTSKFTKSVLNGTQKLLKKASDGIEKLEKKDD